MKYRAQLLACLAALVTAACVHVPDTTPRERELHADELGLDGAVYEPPSAEWWLALGDPELDRLIRAALLRNPGLAASLARVRGAWQQAIAAGAASRPQIDLDASLYREHASANYIYPPPFAGSEFWSGSLGFNFAWQLDFWGRQAALIEQAEATARAAGLQTAAAQLALSGSITQAWVDLQRIGQLQDLAARTRAQRAHIVDLSRRRVTAGLDSNVELRSAESALAQADVDIEQLALARRRLLHAIAELSGGSAALDPPLAEPVIDFAQAIQVPDYLPADLLAHRPDVAAAKAGVAAAQAGRSASEAAFYPNVNLVGFAGLMGISVEKIFQEDSQAWRFGPALHLPVFDAGRLKANYRRSVADLDAAVAGYNQTVLRALRECADELTRVASLDQQLREQQRVLAAAEDAYRFADQRYGAGISGYLSVLSAESQVIAARRQHVNLMADRVQARIALLVALGGRFDSVAAGAATAANTEVSPP